MRLLNKGLTESVYRRVIKEGSFGDEVGFSYYASIDDMEDEFTSKLYSFFGMEPSDLSFIKFELHRGTSWTDDNPWMLVELEGIDDIVEKVIQEGKDKYPMCYKTMQTDDLVIYSSGLEIGRNHGNRSYFDVVCYTTLDRHYLTYQERSEEQNKAIDKQISEEEAKISAYIASVVKEHYKELLGIMLDNEGTEDEEEMYESKKVRKSKKLKEDIDYSKFKPTGKVLSGDRGLSEKEIQEMEWSLPEYYKDMTDEQKQIQQELFLRGMVMSCLTYGEDIHTAVDINAAGDYYHRPYVDEYYDTLGKRVTEKIIKQQTDYFNKGKVIPNVGEDSEGVIYNSFVEPEEMNESKKVRKSKKLKEADTLKDKLDRDEDYVWSEKTSDFKDEADFRNYLDQYFMKDVDIPFNIFDYKWVIIDSDEKRVEPMEPIKESDNLDLATDRMRQAREDVVGIDKKTGIRKKQLEDNIYDIVCLYDNGISDGSEGYEPFNSDEELVNYVYDQVFDQKSDGNGSTRYGNGICKDLKYLGKDYIVSEIKRIGHEVGIVKEEDTEAKIQAEDRMLDYERHGRGSEEQYKRDRKSLGLDESVSYADIEGMVKGTGAEVVFEDICDKEKSDELVSLVNSKNFKSNDEIIEFIETSDEVDNLRNSESNQVGLWVNGKVYWEGSRDEVDETLIMDVADQASEEDGKTYDYDEVDIKPLDESATPEEVEKVKDMVRNPELGSVGSIEEINGKKYYVSDSTFNGYCYKDMDAYYNRPDDVCYICEGGFEDGEDGKLSVDFVNSKKEELINWGSVSTRNSIFDDVRTKLDYEEFYFEKDDKTSIEAKDFDDKLIEILADDAIDMVDWQSVNAYVMEQEESWLSVVEDYYNNKFGKMNESVDESVVSLAKDLYKYTTDISITEEEWFDHLIADHPELSGKDYETQYSYALQTLVNDLTSNPEEIQRQLRIDMQNYSDDSAEMREIKSMYNKLKQSGINIDIPELESGINESAKPKKKKESKEKKDEKRVVMQQGNVTCFKESDDKFLVFENESDNEKEYKDQDSAMQDFMARVGIDPNSELAESIKSKKLTEAGEWDDYDDDNIASKNYLTDIAKEIADSVPGGYYQDAVGFDAYQGPYAVVGSDIDGGELWYYECDNLFELETSCGWIVGSKDELIAALSDKDYLLKLVEETKKLID